MTLIVRKTRHKLSYKNRRLGLTTLERMTIKSVGEHIETLCNISNLTGTLRLDKLIKGMCNIYMDMIIADDSSPRRRVIKHPFYTFDRNTLFQRLKHHHRIGPLLVVCIVWRIFSPRKLIFRLGNFLHVS